MTPEQEAIQEMREDMYQEMLLLKAEETADRRYREQ